MLEEQEVERISSPTTNENRCLRITSPLQSSCPWLKANEEDLNWRTRLPWRHYSLMFIETCRTPPLITRDYNARGNIASSQDYSALSTSSFWDALPFIHYYFPKIFSSERWSTHQPMDLHFKIHFKASSRKCDEWGYLQKFRQHMLYEHWAHTFWAIMSDFNSLWVVNVSLAI